MAANLRFYWIVAAIGLIKILLVAGQDLTARSGLPHDDLLFIKLTRYIFEYGWLGPFDEFTLIKGPMYPIFIGLNYLTGMPMLLTLHLLYILSGLYLARLFVDLTKNERWALVFFTAYIFNPATFMHQMAYVTRDYFYTVLSAFILGLTIQFFLLHQKESKILLRCGLLLGFVLGLFWTTREEGVWLGIPLGLFLFILAAFHFRGHWREWRASPRKATAPLLAYLSPALVAVTIYCAISSLNWYNYRIFTVSEFAWNPFLRAYGALSRIEHENWKQYVPVPRDARLKAYEVSPSFRRLQPVLERPNIWSFGCSSGIKSLQQTCGDIATGWFLFAIRDAASQMGFYGHGSSTTQLYLGIADEIDAACEDGRLKCLSKRASLLPPFRFEYVEQFPEWAWYTMERFLRFSGGGVYQPESSGEKVDLFEILTNEKAVPIVRPPQPVQLSLNSSYIGLQLNGWAYTAEGPVTDIYVEDKDGKRVPAIIRRYGRPDIVALYKDEAARLAGYDLQATFPEGSRAVFGRNGQILAKVPLGKARSPSPVQTPENKQLAVAFDVWTEFQPTDMYRSNAKNLPDRVAWLDRARLGALNLIMKVYADCTIYLFAIALVAAVFLATKIRRDDFWGEYALVAPIGLFSFVATACRVGLLSIASDTSYSEFWSSTYLAPGYPPFFLFLALVYFMLFRWLTRREQGGASAA